MKYEVIEKETGGRCLIDVNAMGEVSVISGPEKLRESVSQYFSRGIWVNACIHKDDTWHMGSERLSPDGPHYYLHLTARMGILGFQVITEGDSIPREDAPER